MFEIIFLFFAAFCKAKFTCSDNGSCDNLGKCLCEDNYYGPDCKSRFNFLTDLIANVNFYCFSAAFCEKETTCSNHGTCGNDGKCTCHVNYFGSNCNSKCNFVVSILIKEKNCIG